MAAKVNDETVKSPGQLTMTYYASCPDVTLTITPALVAALLLSLLPPYIDLNKTRPGWGHRLVHCAVK